MSEGVALQVCDPEVNAWPAVVAGVALRRGAAQAGALPSKKSGTCCTPTAGSNSAKSISVTFN